ncbi:nucleotide exchange factor GrpE [Natronospora cellulosivora (SeqCode)]
MSEGKKQEKDLDTSKEEQENNGFEAKEKEVEKVSDEHEDQSIGESEVENQNKLEKLENEIKEKNENLSQLEDEVSLLKKEKEEYLNRLQRMQAEYSNYRKRSDKEKGQIQSSVAVELIRDILPILDNFERALSQADLGNDFCKGIEMIYRQLINFLKNQGVEEIETLGKEFDHNIHNAVAQVESDEYESGIIIEEVQKGYILAEKVVRPAMVKVVL